MSVYGTSNYDELVYSETRGSIEYRYADYPIEIGESIMINHALYTGLLYSKASPITDDFFHKTIFDYKINRVLQDKEICDLIKDDTYQGIKENELAKETLLDIDLGIISPKLPMEAILEYRDENLDKLQNVREEIHWLAREIRVNPYTEKFYEDIKSNIIPKRIRPKLEECTKNRNAWLKKNKKKWLDVIGISTKAAAITVPLVFSVLPQVTIPLAVLALAFYEGKDLIRKWKNSSKDEINGLHYFSDIMNIKH